MNIIEVREKCRRTSTVFDELVLSAVASKSSLLDSTLTVQNCLIVYTLLPRRSDTLTFDFVKNAYYAFRDLLRLAVVLDFTLFGC